MEEADFEDALVDGEVVAEDIGAIDRGGVDARAGVVTPLDVIKYVGEDHWGIWWRVAGCQTCSKG